MITRLAQVGKDWLASPENTCIRVEYSRVTQAYYVLWLGQVLRIFTDKNAAFEYVSDTFAQ